MYRTGVIDNQNTEKSLAYVAFSINEGVVLEYRRFKGVSDMRMGDIIEIGLADGDHRAIKWRKSATTEIAGFCQQFVGELTQRDGQSFGFVVTNDRRRVFIPPNLMGGAALGVQLVCRAVMGEDKQGKEGWRALTIETASVGQTLKETQLET